MKEIKPAYTAGFLENNEKVRKQLEQWLGLPVRENAEVEHKFSPDLQKILDDTAPIVPKRKIKLYDWFSEE